ncbi:MAG: UvrD-helicase domain-containing protein [Planctomycetota bacterium]
MREATPQVRLVRASAGTGKTYALTTRYLALLRAGVDPATVLATTFTRKAAGEVFERVLTRLAEAVLDNKRREQLDLAIREDALIHANIGPLDEATCGAMMDRLIHRLDRAAINTIDGFFAKLCAAFALELELPVDPTLTDDGSALAAELRETATEAMLGRAADNGFATLLTLLRQLHHDSAKRSVTGSLDRIFRGDAEGLYAAYRQTREAACWPALPHPKLPSREEERELVRRVTDHLGELAESIPVSKSGNSAGEPKKNWLKAYDELKSVVFAGDWPRLANATWANNLINGKGTYDRVPYPERWIELITPLAELGLPAAIHELNLQHRATFELLDRFAKHFEARCLDQRILLFADLTDRLARHLRELDEPTAWRDELAFRIDGQIEHLLIDEFQDTSIDQFAVLRPIIEEVTGDASDQRTLFVVGDAKQSIYGWRGGRVELFDTLESDLKDRGLERRQLDKSYRSSPGVLHAVNLVFNSLIETKAWPKHPEAKRRFAADFREHAAADRMLAGEFELRTTRADPRDNQNGDPDTNPRDAHAHATAEHLRQLTNRWPRATIGVLVRTNAQANTLLQACRQQGISASGETGAALTDHPAVNAVLAALTLADHPGDQIAAFHLAHSPLGEVLRFDHHNHRNAERLSIQIRRDLAARGYADVVGRWVTQLTRYGDASAVRRLRQLANLAEHYRPISILRADAFVRFIESARVEDPSTDRIRIMTVHRAKGLEFDAVVLPYLHGDRGYRPVLLEDRDEDTGPIRAVYRAGKRELREHVPLLQQLHSQAECRHAYEQLCTLYVGLTRARHATHVLMPPVARGNPRAGDSMLAVVLNALLPEARDLAQPEETLLRYEHEGGANAALAVAENQEQVTNQQQRHIPRDWPLRRVKKNHPVETVVPSHTEYSQSPSTEISPGVAPLLDSVAKEQRAAMRWGTRVHAAFQALDFVDEPSSSPDRVHDAEARASLSKAIEHASIRHALERRGASHLRKELPIHRRGVDGRVVRGTLDRLIWWLKPDGSIKRAEVQDFKTDAPPSNLDTPSLGDWLENRRRHHAEQLEHYRTAAAEWLNIPRDQVEATLLFTSVGRVVRW